MLPKLLFSGKCVHAGAGGESRWSREIVSPFTVQRQDLNNTSVVLVAVGRLSNGRINVKTDSGEEVSLKQENLTIAAGARNSTRSAAQTRELTQDEISGAKYGVKWQVIICSVVVL